MDSDSDNGVGNELDLLAAADRNRELDFTEVARILEPLLPPAPAGNKEPPVDEDMAVNLCLSFLEALALTLAASDIAEWGCLSLDSNGGKKGNQTEIADLDDVASTAGTSAKAKAARRPHWNSVGKRMKDIVAAKGIRSVPHPWKNFRDNQGVVQWFLGARSNKGLAEQEVTKMKKFGIILSGFIVKLHYCATGFNTPWSTIGANCGPTIATKADQAMLEDNIFRDALIIPRIEGLDLFLAHGVGQFDEDRKRTQIINGAVIDSVAEVPFAIRKTNQTLAATEREMDAPGLSFAARIQKREQIVAGYRSFIEKNLDEIQKLYTTNDEYDAKIKDMQLQMTQLRKEEKRSATDAKLAISFRSALRGFTEEKCEEFLEMFSDTIVPMVQQVVQKVGEEAYATKIQEAFRMILTDDPNDSVDDPLGDTPDADGAHVSKGVDVTNPEKVGDNADSNEQEKEVAEGGKTGDDNGNNGVDLLQAVIDKVGIPSTTEDTATSSQGVTSTANNPHDLPDKELVVLVQTEGTENPAPGSQIISPQGTENVATKGSQNVANKPIRRGRSRNPTDVPKGNQDPIAGQFGQSRNEGLEPPPAKKKKGKKNTRDGSATGGPGEGSSGGGHADASTAGSGVPAVKGRRMMHPMNSNMDDGDELNREN